TSKVSHEQLGSPNRWPSTSYEVCSENQILAGAVSADHLCRVSSGFCSGSTETESVKHLGWNQFHRQDGGTDCCAVAPPTRAQPEQPDRGRQPGFQRSAESHSAKLYRRQ